MTCLLIKNQSLLFYLERYLYQQEEIKKQAKKVWNLKAKQHKLSNKGSGILFDIERLLGDKETSILPKFKIKFCGLID